MKVKAPQKLQLSLDENRYLVLFESLSWLVLRSQAEMFDSVEVYWMLLSICRPVLARLAKARKSIRLEFHEVVAVAHLMRMSPIEDGSNARFNILVELEALAPRSTANFTNPLEELV